MELRKDRQSAPRYAWIAASCVVGAGLGQLVVMVDGAVAQEQQEQQDDSDTVGAPVEAPAALPPELRESADNNVSFPVDI